MLLRRLNTSDAEYCNDGHSLLKLGFKSHFMECLVLKLSLQGAIARHVLVGLAGILGSVLAFPNTSVEARIHQCFMKLTGTAKILQLNE